MSVTPPSVDPGRPPRLISEPIPHEILVHAAPSTAPSRRDLIVRTLPWVIIALPAIYQLVLLTSAISGRITHPYDLEWMEGGMLHHALRIHDGQGIYVPPSVDFIPYLYTPLYPSLLAMFGGAFGITYTLGRVISVLALIGLGAAAALQIGGTRHEHPRRGPVWAGIALALGLFAAVYPYVEGWFDLVRADTLFLLMITAGIAGLPRWARAGEGLQGHGRVAAGASILALAFFCKQTGFVYVAFGGLVIAVLSWRRGLTYVGVAGAIGLGGTWLLNRTTHGWFWTYVSEIHRAHDFNKDRFWKSFGNILWHFPAMTIVIVLVLIAVLATRIFRGVLPRQAHPLLLWSATFVVSTIVGAVGWGTEFAHFNAYMPAFLHGAMAAGAAVPALLGCAILWWGDRPRLELVAHGSALAAAILLAVTCWTNRWDPHRFMPTPSDVSAGDRLIARIRAIDGEVWMPSHPWYLQLANKTPRVHRMGIKDVTARQPRVVEGLDEALEHRAFAAIIVDDRDLQQLPRIRMYYRPVLKLPRDERPRVYTGAGSAGQDGKGAQVTPDAIWVPALPSAPPPLARVVFSFETPAWDGWTRSGPAWGNGPVAETQPGQDLVIGAGGVRFATSMTAGDGGMGRISSPMFMIEGVSLTLRLGGGTDQTKLRVELWVGEVVAKVASVPEPGGDTLRTVTVDVSELRGKEARLVFVDDTTRGHLNVDDVWIWQAP